MPSNTSVPRAYGTGLLLNPRHRPICHFEISAKKRAALGHLRPLISEIHTDRYRNVQDPRVLWQQLEADFGKSLPIRSGANYLTHVVDLPFLANPAKIDEFLLNFDRLIQILESVGVALSDVCQRDLLLLKLPQEFQQIQHKVFEKGLRSNNASF